MENRVNTYLTAKVLDLDGAALEGHHHARLELVLGALELLLRHRGVQEQAQLMHQVRQDLPGRVPAAQARRCRHEGRKETEQRRVSVDVVERRAVIHLRVVVEDMSV